MRSETIARQTVFAVVAAVAVTACSGGTAPTTAASSTTSGSAAASLPVGTEAAPTTLGAVAAGSQRLTDVTFEGVPFDVEIHVTNVEEVAGVEDVPESARVLRIYYEVLNHGTAPLDENNAFNISENLATEPANEAIPLILLDFSGADCPTLGTPPVAPGATGAACSVFQVPRDVAVLGLDFEIIGGEAGTVRVEVAGV